jgi:hypothetical protein
MRGYIQPMPMHWRRAAPQWTDPELLDQMARELEAARERDRRRCDLAALGKYSDGLFARVALRAIEDAEIARAAGVDDTYHGLASDRVRRSA